MSAFPCQQDFYCVVVVFSCVTGVLSLRLVSLDVPTAVMHGEAIWLNCTLDLERDELYSVKWYKNDVEFYRFLPRDSPSGQKYDLLGVYVDLSKSKQGHVFLQKTDLHTEGLYRCEASAESPTFQTVEGEKEIMVYVPPQEGPRIQGSQPRYAENDIVNISCKSGPSKPAATIKWYINGKEISSDLYISYPTIDLPNGLQTSLAGLTFQVGGQHLLNGGTIIIRCTAIVYQIFFLTSEELIIGDSMAQTSSLADFSRGGPKITGGSEHYRVGDVVNVNCSSSKSIQPAELHWYINDEPAKNEILIKYPKQNYSDGLSTSLLGLQFIVEEKHFGENDEMRLKCTATLSKAVSIRSDEKIVGDNHKKSGFQAAENAGRVTTNNGSSRLHQYGVSSFLLLFFVIVLRVS